MGDLHENWIETKPIQMKIGNYIAEQVVNNDPYLFDADGEQKIVGKNVWKVTHENRKDFLYYSKTKQRAKERMFYLAQYQP
jgi:hypothetical protein